MPSCKNGTGSYKGTEPSPKGRGFCARHEKIKTKKKGRDKKMWIVRSVKLSSGKRSKRWFKVLPKAKKSVKAKAKKKTTKKKKTTRKKLRGGEDLLDKIESLDMEEYGNGVQHILKRFHRKLAQGTMTKRNIRKELNDTIVTMEKLKQTGHDVGTGLDDHTYVWNLLFPPSTKSRTVTVSDVKGHKQLVGYDLDDEIYDTLEDAGFSGVKKLIVYGEALYNSKNKNLTWAQLIQKFENRGKSFGNVHTVHAI